MMPHGATSHRYRGIVQDISCLAATIDVTFDICTLFNSNIGILNQGEVVICIIFITTSCTIDITITTCSADTDGTSTDVTDVNRRFTCISCKRSLIVAIFNKCSNRTHSTCTIHVVNNVSSCDTDCCITLYDTS